MNLKLLCVVIAILYIIIIFIILNKYLHIRLNKNLNEGFASNAWTTNKDQLTTESTPLNDTQKTEIKNMITSISSAQLKDMVSTQSPLLTGPQGPPGAIGPSGTTLIASGRLINKSGSYPDTSNTQGPNTGPNYFNPSFIVSRTEGTSPSSSLSFMDSTQPFVSYQNWELDINNNIKNRYDETCLTMSDTQDKIYMATCASLPSQKWTWDKTNRLISTSKSTSTNLKCIGLTPPEKNIITTNIPGTTTNNSSNSSRRYLVVKDCAINTSTDDELWSFI